MTDAPPPDHERASGYSLWLMGQEGGQPPEGLDSSENLARCYLDAIARAEKAEAAYEDAEKARAEMVERPAGDPHDLGQRMGHGPHNIGRYIVGVRPGRVTGVRGEGPDFVYEGVDEDGKVWAAPNRAAVGYGFLYLARPRDFAEGRCAWADEEMF